MPTTNLQSQYAIPAELSSFIDDGFLVPVSETPDEKTLTLAVPSLDYQDENGAQFTFSLIWIHPDFNREFCHVYNETPGDLPNFNLVKESRNAPDEEIELDSLDDLIDWLEERKDRNTM